MTHCDNCVENLRTGYGIAVLRVPATPEFQITIEERHARDQAWWQMIELSGVTEAIRKDPANHVSARQCAAERHPGILQYGRPEDSASQRQKSTASACRQSTTHSPRCSATATITRGSTGSRRLSTTAKSTHTSAGQNWICGSRKTVKLRMITRGEELTLTAVRYLRRCLLEGDIEALIAATIQSVGL